ncbi:hypothetical protein FEZ51_06475 [Pediococcus stilesii]|uniref:Uncharacterized protein n=1 Tax=Pediococcus stilesii TaxID=331679 RepID=A0A5R9BTX2_9LACO|nr:hypothetical protein [Pediococcus stilesii]TLQ04067.1 hypothetical protein FEZ51_06475 [Pediococcus stilesii]
MSEKEQKQPSSEAPEEIKNTENEPLNNNQEISEKTTEEPMEQKANPVVEEKTEKVNEEQKVVSGEINTTPKNDPKSAIKQVTNSSFFKKYKNFIFAALAIIVIFGGWKMMNRSKDAIIGQTFYVLDSQPTSTSDILDSDHTMKINSNKTITDSDSTDDTSDSRWTLEGDILRIYDKNYGEDLSLSTDIKNPQMLGKHRVYKLSSIGDDVYLVSK